MLRKSALSVLLCTGMSTVSHKKYASCSCVHLGPFLLPRRLFCLFSCRALWPGDEGWRARRLFFLVWRGGGAFILSSGRRCGSDMEDCCRRCMFASQLTNPSPLLGGSLDRWLRGLSLCSSGGTSSLCACVPRCRGWSLFRGRGWSLFRGRGRSSSGTSSRGCGWSLSGTSSRSFGGGRCAPPLR